MAIRNSFRKLVLKESKINWREEGDGVDPYDDLGVYDDGDGSGYPGEEWLIDQVDGSNDELGLDDEDDYFDDGDEEYDPLLPVPESRKRRTEVTARNIMANRELVARAAASDPHPADVSDMFPVGSKAQTYDGEIVTIYGPAFEVLDEEESWEAGAPVGAVVLPVRHPHRSRTQYFTHADLTPV